METHPANDSRLRRVQDFHGLNPHWAWMPASKIKNMKQKHYRQGDVLIERVNSIPKTAKKQPKQKIILAHGEATGHHHAIEERDPADWWKEEDGTQYVNARGVVEVTHQEHSTIKLPIGKYRVTRQVEYSPEAIRNVAD